MKSSQIKNKLDLPESRLPVPLQSHAVLALLAVSLLVSVLIGYSPRRAGAQARKPFDLVSKVPDANGFEFNPKWAWQDANTGVPDPNELCFNGNGEFEGCTSDTVDFDEPDPFKILHQTCRITAETAVKGHINWRPVAYEARISWSEFSIDGDYCFEIAPLDKNGLTANRETMHVEFHARETIRQFNTPWWKEFRKSVGIRNIGIGMGKKEKEFTSNFVNGKRAVVIGLLNLDCVHKCYTELHPVYAIAINVKSDMNDDGTIDEVWAVFARNWGNEGWCSRNQHNLNLETNSNRLLLTLPWGPDIPAGKAASSFEVLNDGTRFLSSSNQAKGPELSIAGTQGILLSFVFPPAKDQARIHGELRLRWRMPTTVGGQPPLTSNATTSAVSTRPQEEEVEEKLLFDALGTEGRKRIASESQLGTPDAIPQRVTVKREIGTNRLFKIFDKLTRTETLIIQPAPPAQPPRVESMYDSEKAERDKRLLGIPPSRPE